MKLRNKKTGEIGELHFEPDKEYHFTVATEDPADMMIFKTLAELNEEWEDYEEPNYFWFIDKGGVEWGVIEFEENLNLMKSIGNYFETKEEAEKAVEKLKAFANLRKRGLKFNGWDEADRGMVGEFAIYCDALELDGIERELGIVFGREEL